MKKKKKKIENMKNILFRRKPPLNYHDLLAPNLIKKFYSKKQSKKTHKITWPTSAKSDT